MKVKYWSPNKRLCLEAEGDVKEVFKQLAVFEEVFCKEINPVTKGTNLAFSVREHDGNDFFELRDKDNKGWKLPFGQTKVGNKLFPKSWEKYDPDAPNVKSSATPPKKESADIPF